MGISGYPAFPAPSAERGRDAKHNSDAFRIARTRTCARQAEVIVAAMAITSNSVMHDDVEAACPSAATVIATSFSSAAIQNLRRYSQDRFVAFGFSR